MENTPSAATEQSTEDDIINNFAYEHKSGRCNHQQMIEALVLELEKLKGNGQIDPDKQEEEELKNDILTATKQLTYGKNLVGITFDSDAAFINAQYAEIIDKLNSLITEKSTAQQKRHIATAITQAQTAQMWAVKAVTLPEYV